MRRLVLAFASLVLLATTSCGGDGPTGTGSIEGTYILRSVNGEALPYTLIQIGSDRTQIVSDRYDVLQGGAYTNVAVIRTTEAGTTEDVTVTDAGDWELSGDVLTFFSNDGETVFEAEFTNGNTLTMEGFIGSTLLVLVYRK